MKTLAAILFTFFLSAPAQMQPVALRDKAPELIGGPWLNTPNNKPLTLASRKGKVTVVQFWTYLCENCRNNLPIYQRWHEKFGPKDVTIIGVHSPELKPEFVRANIEKAVKDFRIEYPVLMDLELRNWQRWDQQYWPAVYLIDKQGRIRYRWEGEMNFAGQTGEAAMAAKIEQLLAEP